MIAKLKHKLIGTEEKKRLMSNAFSLGSLQAANFILPLVTLPYLVRVLGVENYGVLALATAVVAYLMIIVDYGFNITATRSISINRDNQDKLIEIFSSVMQIKFLLTIFSFVILVFLVYAVDVFYKYWSIYILSFGVLVGQFLFPTWFFQGMERMKYIAYLSLFSKVIFTVAIFILVKEEKDLYRVPVLTSLGFIVVGLWSLIIIKREFGVSFCYQKTETLTSYLTGGKNIFIASLSGNLYGQGSTIILGLFVTPAIVGYYSLAQKLSSALVSVFQVLSQTLMPYFSKVKQEDEHIFFLIVKKFFWVVFFASTLLFGITALLSDYIYNLVSGFDSSIGYYAFSFWLIIGVLTVFNVYFNIVIVALNQDKFMAQFYMFVGLSFICYGTLLTLLYSYQGMLISMLIVEMLILFFSLVAIKRGAMPVVKVSK